MNLVHLVCPLVVIPHTKSKNRARDKTNFSILPVRLKILKGYWQLADVLTRPSIISERLCTSGDILGGCRKGNLASIFKRARRMTQGYYRLVSLTLVPGKVMKWALLESTCMSRRRWLGTVNMGLPNIVWPNMIAFNDRPSGIGDEKRAIDVNFYFSTLWSGWTDS